ncbi:RluA family pseudouridine synthase, partial [Paenibacillus sp. TRM 82003]|nr:RluA family pseudouridine synthase [Paenibacillus sp. TRM 82003]
PRGDGGRGAREFGADRPRGDGGRGAREFGADRPCGDGGRGAREFGADRAPRMAPPAGAMQATRQGLQLSAAKRRGEWMELKLPEQLAGIPLHALMRILPIPQKVAGRLISVNGVMRMGKLLKLKLFPEERPEFEGEWRELNILYEDDFTLVVNKPEGMEVHPSAKGQTGTLAHAVAAYYNMTNQSCRVRHVHRLDKDTTGPVLYAKNELAHYVFDLAMREKRMERIYTALAEGVIASKSGVIDAPIGQDRHHSTRRRVSETGEKAVTRYEVIETFADHTYVRLRLETGRTHQIRVHLSHLGHPIAGDGLYGGHRPLIHRQALHGEKLVWQHPWTNERMEVRAPLPDDFAAVLRTLRESQPPQKKSRPRPSR